MNPEYWWAIGLALAIVITAALVNKLAPTSRGRLRAITVLYVLYAIALFSAEALKYFDQLGWANRVFILAEVLRAFAVVGLAGTLVFRLALAGIGVTVPTIDRKSVV